MPLFSEAPPHPVVSSSFSWRTGVPTLAGIGSLPQLPGRFDSVQTTVRMFGVVAQVLDEGCCPPGATPIFRL